MRINLILPILALLFISVTIPLQGQVEENPVAKLETDSIHCEIGHNFNSGTRGVIHLWKKNDPLGMEKPEEPYDVMWWGEYDYVKIDDEWFIEEGEDPSSEKLFGIKDTGYEVNDDSTLCTLIFDKQNNFTVTKKIQPLVKKFLGEENQYPAIKVTYIIKNNTSKAHDYTIYHADDYSFGGIKRIYTGYKDETYAHLKGDETPIANSRIVEGSETNCIISHLNCLSDDPDKQYYTFLGVADKRAQFYVGKATDVVKRNFVDGYDIEDDKSISVGLKYEIGRLAPGRQTIVWFYLGVSKTWEGINSLADEILSPSDGNLSVIPSQLNPPEYEDVYNSSIKLRNNSDNYIMINDTIVEPVEAQALILKLEHEGNDITDGIEIPPYDSVLCDFSLFQPPHYSNLFQLNFEYQVEPSGQHGSEPLIVEIIRQAPKTQIENEVVEIDIDDTEFKISGVIDDVGRGNSFLDSTFYFDNIRDGSFLGAFELDNITYSFTDLAIPVPDEWAPGSVHKLYFVSSDRSGHKGRFSVPFEYDSLQVFVGPKIYGIEPASGEYKDPVAITVNAAGYDSIYIALSKNGVDSLLYAGATSNYFFSSDWNRDDIYLKARAKKRNNYSPWFINSNPITIDNTPPLTSCDYPVELQGVWQNTSQIITLQPTDNLSGFDDSGETRYSTDGSAPGVVLKFPYQITVLNQDESLKFLSIDDAGNVESQKSVVVKVDTQKPDVVQHSGFLDFDSGSNGIYWVGLKVSDNLSGVISQQVKFDFRYGDGEYQELSPASVSGGVYTYAVPEPVGGWLSLLDQYLDMKLTAEDYAGNIREFKYHEFIQKEDLPPYFSKKVEDQVIYKTNSFAIIENLDTYVIDEEVDDLTWEITHSDSDNFDIFFDQLNYRFTINQNEEQFVGRDTVYFQITDKAGYTASDTAQFAILDTNFVPVITNLVGQSVAMGEPFTSFDLDEFVNDADHDDRVLSWSEESPTQLKVVIDPVTHICDVYTESLPGMVDNNVVIEAAVKFMVADPLGASTEKTVVFQRGDYPIVIHEIDDQRIDEDGYFEKIKAADYVTSLSGVAEWSFSFSSDGLNYLDSDPANKFEVLYDNSDIEIKCRPDSSGMVYVRFKVDNGEGDRDSTVAQFQVNPINDAPYFSHTYGDTVSHGESFTVFDLYELGVIDVETPAGPFQFQADETENFRVEMDFSTLGSVMTNVINKRPNYNGLLEDSILFSIKDGEGGIGSRKFNFRVEPTGLYLDIAGQTINQGGEFATYSLVEIVSGNVNLPSELGWSWQHLAGDQMITPVFNLETEKLQLDISGIEVYGNETIEFSVTDLYTKEIAKDTVVFTIIHENTAPLISLNPSEKLQITDPYNQNYFTSRKIELADDDLETLSISYYWKLNEDNPLFEVDPAVLSNDTLKVKNNMLPYLDDNDTLVMIVKDPVGLADTAYAVYEVFFDDPPVLSEIPLIKMETSPDTTIYLDQFVEDPDNSDAELEWSFAGSEEFIEIAESGVDPDLGSFVRLSVLGDLYNVKYIEFTVNDPAGKSDKQDVGVVRGISLDSIEVSDTTNVNPRLALSYLNDDFVKVQFPMSADSGRAGFGPDLTAEKWVPLRKDSSLIHQFDVFTLKELEENNEKVNIYAQIKKNNEPSLPVCDSITLDFTVPTGSFSLKSLSGDYELTESDTVYLEAGDFSTDIDKYAYSVENLQPDEASSLWVDELKTKFVLQNSGWLYLFMKDSAGNIGSASDYISYNKIGPKLVLTEPDLVELAHNNNEYSRAELRISGYDSAKVTTKVTIRTEHDSFNPLVLEGDDLEGDSLKFSAMISLLNGEESKVEITAVDSMNNENKIEFSIVFLPKKHFVLTLNGDGYNDVCYFNTGTYEDAVVDIFSLRGDHIVTRKYNKSSNEPPYWDGKGKNGKTVPGGLYIFKVKAAGKEKTGTVAVVK